MNKNYLKNIFVTNCNDSIFCLNLIGYGCTISENGKLYNDLSKLSTALDIFSTRKLIFKN